MMTKSEARILVVDAVPHMRRTLRRMLRHLGYPNVEENDGTTVLNRVKLYPYDLVICDLRMEPQSGLDVLEFVRGDPDLKDLPFILLTGAAVETTVTAAMTIGASDFIAKPFSAQTLGDKVERLLAGIRSLTPRVGMA